MKWMSAVFVKSIALSLALFLSLLVAEPDPSVDPPYAKWGLIAVKEAQKKYNSEITDYLHIGRINLSPTEAEETFKLLLSRQGMPAAVLATVRFNTVTERLISIKFRDTQP
ncbi:YqzG/YhdC family protein [Paenibacillus cellulositrophicus]|uniref:DUF3889 domain-containing protein n=1 Tax=Paenibacillus cellulositrophicus TaxID=562959 RepID=UPI00204058BD|nr:DUF3889 domain-containing protein [Paenibacillus cellulositrophicus]MCM2997562.1 YqzG/YhdC family protein [Paenibacillus cellulositrophicus]